MFQYLFCVCLGIYLERFYRYRLTPKNFDFLVQTVSGSLYTAEIDPWDEWTEHLKDLAEMQEADKAIELTKASAQGQDDTTTARVPVCQQESEGNEGEKEEKRSSWSVW